VSHLTIYKYKIQHAAFSCADFGSYVMWGSYPITRLFLNGQHLCSQFMPPASPPVYKKSDPCSSAMYVQQACKYADVNPEHIQNLPWLKLSAHFYSPQAGHCSLFVPANISL